MRPGGIKIDGHDALTEEHHGTGDDAGVYFGSVVWTEGDQLVSVYSDGARGTALEVAKAMTIRRINVPLLGNAIGVPKPRVLVPAVLKAGSQRCVMWTDGTPVPACGPAGTSFIGTLSGVSAQSSGTGRLLGGVPSSSISVDVTAPGATTSRATLQAEPGVPDLKVFEVSVPQLPSTYPAATSGVYSVTVRAPGRPDQTFRAVAVVSGATGPLAPGSAARLVGAPFNLPVPGLPNTTALSVQPLDSAVCVVVNGVCTAPVSLHGDVALLQRNVNPAATRTGGDTFNALVGLVRADAASLTLRGQKSPTTDSRATLTISARIIADPLPIPGWKEFILEFTRTTETAAGGPWEITLAGADGRELARVSSSTTGRTIDDVPEQVLGHENERVGGGG